MAELYRFKHIPTAEYGLPFTLCLRHVKVYKVPSSCVMQKLGESDQKCFMCEEWGEKGVGDAQSVVVDNDVPVQS